MDAASEPIGYLVVSDSGDRIHYLDWGGISTPGVVLVHGLAASAWAWTAVSRRLAATARRTVAMDLRGHGLSDAPTATGAYDLDEVAGDVVAVAEGSGALAGGAVTLAGHGFGAAVAASAAARLGDRCARLVLIDGGLADVADATGQDVDEFLRGLEEPPEIMRSMNAYLRDRRSWDPATWDADQEQAARAAVVETPAGKLVSATRPHALEASVRTMFGYRPSAVLPGVTARVVVVRRTTRGDDDTTGVGEELPAGATVIDLPAPGHNLLRYRPDEVTAAILGG
ncbi:MAG TPA: alpha/beta hydrolase [Candidatus Limnocylindrales bacterium]|nr:alpha/beta hydrolase [Candidatus Limnocylindrales bacterium]